VVELVSAANDGWSKLRLTTTRRDGGCVAVQPKVMGEQIATDLCRNGHGWVIRYDDLFQLEWDHVKEFLATSLRAPHDEAHGVSVCAWHHRGTGWRSDSQEHRQKIREYLAKLYPDVWADVPAVQ
jgi:hypothetical protein